MLIKIAYLIICLIYNFIAVDCGTPVAPEDGTFSLFGLEEGSTTYLSKATFSCDRGFDLRGQAFTFCRADGTWDIVNRTCIRKQY